MTETELILGSLTVEELDDAHRYVAMLGRSWRSQSKDETRRVGLDTDGPIHAIAALAAAVLREMAIRGGAEPWYAGMPTDGHPARLELDLYARRYGLREHEASQSRAGVMERVCVLCGEAKPQDDRHFTRPEGLWGEICRACQVPDQMLAAQLVEQYPAPAPPPIAEEDLLRML